MPFVVVRHDEKKRRLIKMNIRLEDHIHCCLSSYQCDVEHSRCKKKFIEQIKDVPCPGGNSIIFFFIFILDPCDQYLGTSSCPDGLLAIVLFSPPNKENHLI